MAVSATHGVLSATQHSVQLRKAVIAATVGTTIEWYDFPIYSTMTGLVFGHVFMIAHPVPEFLSDKRQERMKKAQSVR